LNRQYCPYCMNPVSDGESCKSCGLTAGSYTPNENHLPPGTVLNGRYLIGRVLGEGGFGITYIGCDLRLELKVAIKEYFPIDKVQRISSVSLDLSVPSSYAEHGFLSGKDRFLEEARIMARMDKQPEIVSVRDFFECHNTAYIVMEYVEGTTFKQLVTQRGGGIPAHELLPLIEPLFGALTNLHELGLIHRDISPDNLMLERGRVRLIDFGCARQPERGEATMTIVLKHGYAPIEQYTNRGQGPWTDVYALSATIYYCLVGQRPPQAMDRASEDELILPRKLGVDLTEAQEQAILRGMGIRRSQRFASVAQFYAALYRAPESETEPTPKPTPTPVPAPAPMPVQEPTVSIERHTEQEPPFEPTISIDQHTETLPEPEPAPAAQEKPWWKDWRGIAAMAVGLLLIVGMLAVLIPTQPEKDPSEADAEHEEVQGDPGQDPQEDSAEDQPAEDVFDFVPMTERGYPMDEPVDDALFRDAYAVENEEQSLNWHLEQGAESVALQNLNLCLEGDVYLTQNLLVGENANLDLQGILTVAPGVTLQVSENGQIHGGHIIRLEQGAQLNLRQDGRIHNSTILMEDGETALRMSESESVRRVQEENGTRFVNLELSAFEEATTVHNATEFREAADNPDTRAIIIAGDIKLTQYDHFELTVPVRIETDVNVRAPLNNGLNSSLILRHSLTNHGSLRTCMEIVDGAYLENHGELVLQSWADSQSVVVNHGEFRAQDGVDIKYGSRFYNYGTMDLQAGSSLLVIGADLRNYAELRSAGEITIPRDGYLENCGTLTLQGGGHLYNRSVMENHGTMILEDGSHLQNEGTLYYGHDLQQAPDAYFENHGVAYSHNPYEVLDIEDRAPVLLEDNLYYGEVRSVHTAEEFQAAMDDRNVDTIEVNGDIELQESIVVEKDLIIGHILRMAQDTTLEIHGAVLNHGTLHADRLLLQNGGYLINHNLVRGSSLTLGNDGREDDRAYLLNYGQLESRDMAEDTLAITLCGESALINRGGLSHPGEIQLHHNAMFNQNGWMDDLTQPLTVHGGALLLNGAMGVRNAAITIESGIFRLYGYLALYEESTLHLGEGATMDILEGDIEMDEAASMENHGAVMNFGFNWYNLMLHGLVKNFGRWDTAVPMTVGAFHNLGEVRLYGISHGNITTEREFLGNDPVVGQGDPRPLNY